MRTVLIATIASLAVVVVPKADQCTPDVAAPRSLSVGEMAQDFSLPGSDGRTYRLSDYRGKQAVVLTWFAKAGTSG
jgi:cytochrome oxidase Cu insertion factor (SCO1/SenC/PrrC family)